jgi:hypothetical protein
MSLRQLQSVFAHRVARLILKADELGYQVTFGEAWRSPEEAARLAQQAKGRALARSLHCDRLAIDLNLFRNGVWLTGTEDHRPLGEWWESQSDDIARCAWGGRFQDGNHYSLEYQGRK